MLEKASNAKKILMLFMSENAKNYAGLFYRWLVGTTGRDVDMLLQAVEVTDIFCKFTSLRGLVRHEPCCVVSVKSPSWRTCEPRVRA